MIAGLGAFGLGLTAPSGVSNAQDAAQEGGVIFELTASQTLRASDNLDIEDPAVSGVRSITGINGSISSITREQSFVLGFAAGAELDNDGFELGNTGVDLTYMRMGESGQLTLDARYFQRQIRSEFQGDDLETLITNGTQTDYGYGAAITLGANRALTLDLSARQDFREFDTTDPDAVNSRTTRASAEVAARIDEATDGRATFSFTEREEDDAANQLTATSRSGLGITRRLGNASTVSADVNWTRVAVTETAITRDTTVTTGIGGRLAFDRDLPNGRFTAALSRQVTEDGPIDELRIGRGIDFPASSLFIEGGVVLTDQDILSPLVGLTYERQLTDGALNFSLTQTAGINGDDETVISTRGASSLRRSINDISSWQASVGVRNDAETVAGGTTTRRIDGSLSYSRDLTRMAGLTAGYQYALISETGQADRQSNTIFVTLSTSLTARP
ncbi:MAG: hypothetical protein AAFW64_10760 [Pseudomonadota bacterium]